MIRDHTFLYAIMLGITALMLSIGLGWLRAITDEWRLRKPRSPLRNKSRSRPPAKPRWYVQWKWTAIQLYQKLTRRRYKK